MDAKGESLAGQLSRTSTFTISRRALMRGAGAAVLTTLVKQLWRPSFAHAQETLRELAPCSGYGQGYIANTCAGHGRFSNEFHNGLDFKVGIPGAPTWGYPLEIDHPENITQDQDCGGRIDILTNLKLNDGSYAVVRVRHIIPDKKIKVLSHNDGRMVMGSGTFLRPGDYLGTLYPSTNSKDCIGGPGEEHAHITVYRFRGFGNLYGGNVNPSDHALGNKFYIAPERAPDHPGSGANLIVYTPKAVRGIPQDVLAPPSLMAPRLGIITPTINDRN